MTKILAVALGTLMMMALVPAAVHAQASTVPAPMMAYGYYGGYYRPYYGYACYGPYYLWYGPCYDYPSYGFGFGDKDFRHDRDFHGGPHWGGMHGGFHGGYGGGRR